MTITPNGAASEMAVLRLIAAMNATGVGKIPTFNTQDFIRFSNIEVLHPESVR